MQIYPLGSRTWGLAGIGTMLLAGLGIVGGAAVAVSLEGGSSAPLIVGVLFLLVVEIPKTFLSFPPLHDTAESGYGEQDLDEPAAAGPFRMLIPEAADALDAGDELGARTSAHDQRIDRDIQHLHGNRHQLFQWLHPRPGTRFSRGQRTRSARWRQARRSGRS